MKNSFITFLVFIINLGLFHASFASNGNEAFSYNKDCAQSMNMHTDDENNCAKECFAKINSFSIDRKGKSDKKLNKILYIFHDNYNNQTILHHKKFLFYDDFQSYVLNK